MATPHHQLEVKYRRSRVLNIVLGAVVVFLAIVLAAQLMPGQSPVSDTATNQSESPELSENSEASGNPDASEAPEEAPEGTQTADEFEFVQRDPDDPTALGEVDASVVLTVWTDMRCPYCALFARDTLPDLVQEYVDTDRVRIEFNEVAFFGEQSEDAAIAARAAAHQGVYFDYITTVYGAAPESGHHDLPRSRLIEFAEQVGVADMERFESDLDDPDLRTQVKEGTAYAQYLGVNSVPFFAAGSSALAGAQPIENFQTFLDEALAAAE